MLAPANRAARETAVVANLAVFRIAFPPITIFIVVSVKILDILFFDARFVTDREVIAGRIGASYIDLSQGPVPSIMDRATFASTGWIHTN